MRLLPPSPPDSHSHRHGRLRGDPHHPHRPHHDDLPCRPLRTGFEQLQASGYATLHGRRVGVVTNPTGVTRDVRHIVDVMHADPTSS